MKKCILACVSVLLLLATIVTVFSSPTPAYAAVKAFPTAEGFGANAIGGRGGRVIEVTNLNDSGAGSLRDAVTQSGPRIVVFRVSGTIVLQSTLNITEPFLTIAGQTSPGGIQIKGTPNVPTGISFNSGIHNVIVRHLRVRIGGPSVPDIGEPFLFYGNTGSTVHDVIVDHVSIEWGTDSQFMSYGNVDNVTFQWGIIAEGAKVDASASSGLGTHVGSSDTMNISIHHTLHSSNGDRNPLIQRVGLADFRNNLVYNWGGNNSGDFGYFDVSDTHGTITANIVNNVYIPGPSGGAPIIWLNNGGPTRVDGSAAFRGGTKVYSSGNWGIACPSGCADDFIEYHTLDYYKWNGDQSFPNADPAVFRANTPFAVPGVTTDPTSQVEAKVLANVGANKPSRDSVDTRIVNDVQNGTGCITCVGFGGPWPTLTGPAAPTDSDHDGMPDSWESSHGLNPSDPNDGAQTSSSGYTNLENYLNELAGDNGGGITPTPTQTPQPTPIGSLCSTLFPGTAIGTGFGTPWNVFNLSELLLKAFCNGPLTTAIMGPSTYVYSQGYAWVNTNWQQTTFTCTGGALVSNAWCPQGAQGTLPQTSTYYVAYTCNWTGSKWNCGCADTNCSTNYWQLQKIN